MLPRDGCAIGGLLHGNLAKVKRQARSLLQRLSAKMSPHCHEVRTYNKRKRENEATMMVGNTFVSKGAYEYLQRFTYANISSDKSIPVPVTLKFS